MSNRSTPPPPPPPPQHPLTQTLRHRTYQRRPPPGPLRLTSIRDQAVTYLIDKLGPSKYVIPPQPSRSVHCTCYSRHPCQLYNRNLNPIPYPRNEVPPPLPPRRGQSSSVCRTNSAQSDVVSPSSSVTTCSDPGSPWSVGAGTTSTAATSPACTSPPYSAIPKQEDADNFSLGEEDDKPPRLGDVRRLGPLMNFNFSKSRINAGGDVASHNIINSTINAFDEETMSYIQYSKLPRAKNAPYNCADRAIRGPCTDGTRTEFLDQLSSWLRDVSAPKVAWISGMAGTGKTTIAYSLSEELQRAGLYGGSFFCSQRYEDCTRVGNILPTLAISLARQLPSYAMALQEVLKNDLDPGHCQVKQQFQDLFVVPFQSLDVEDTRVVVIDALDECDDEEAVADLISALTHPSASALPLKFILTSEQDRTIKRAFKTLALNEDYTSFCLHEVPLDAVSGDIERYISESLIRMMEGRSEFDGCDLDWPPLDQVGVLTRRADRLFLYAATACRYVGKGHSIRERLEDITSDDFKLMDSGLDTEPIDSLYRGILKKAFKGRNGKETMRLKLVLSSIVSLRDSLSMDALSTLLDEVNVQSTLVDLHSVISVPQTKDGFVSAFHASFPEFLHDASRSFDLHMNPTESHLDLAKRCIFYLQKNLRQNVCCLPQPVPNADIQPEVIEKSVPNVMRYACVFFTSHYLLAIGQDAPANQHSEIQTIIWEFMNKHALKWVECLSILGQVPVVLGLLNVAGPSMTGGDSRKRQQSLADFGAFVGHNMDRLSHSCLSVYEVFKLWKEPRSDARTA